MADIIISIAIFLVGAIISVIGGKYLSLTLPILIRQFDRKPFNCRPCITFHLFWIISVGYSINRQSWVLALVGLALSFVIFFVVKLIDSKKITE